MSLFYCDKFYKVGFVDFCMGDLDFGLLAHVLLASDLARLEGIHTEYDSLASKVNGSVGKLNSFSFGLRDGGEVDSDEISRLITVVREIKPNVERMGKLVRSTGCLVDVGHYLGYRSQVVDFSIKNFFNALSRLERNGGDVPAGNYSGIFSDFEEYVN